MKLTEHDKKEIEYLIEWQKKYLKWMELSEEERHELFLKAMRGEQNENRRFNSKSK